jgi:hypothetical protein
MGSTTLVILVLLRRQFYSNARDAILKDTPRLTHGRPGFEYGLRLTDSQGTYCRRRNLLFSGTQSSNR